MEKTTKQIIEQNSGIKDTTISYDAHREDLRKSGLIEETIKAAGLYSVPQNEIKKIIGWTPPVESAIVFPYPGTGYIRLKVFPPYKDKKGHLVKYLQCPNTLPDIYIPPLVIDKTENPTIPIGISEGEKKALKASQEGLCCIGIGGLWSWLKDGKPIDGLDHIAWAGRSVILYPDSDVWARPDLLQAIYALGKELDDRGANIEIAQLPGGSNPKVGLDDFLLDNKVQELKRLSVFKLAHKTFNRTEKWWVGWKAKKDVASKQTEVVPPMTAEEKEEALALLKSKDFLTEFLKLIEKSGCVGEPDNKIILYLACSSRLLSTPINITIKGESSAGKNFLANSVQKFIPQEDVKAISNATPKAFYYLPEDLSHKIIMIAEAPGGQDADYSIRTFQSEGEIVIIVPEKDKATGRIETKERKVKGPVAFIQTTTKTHLHAENETRNFDIFIDESEEQTNNIFRMQNNRYEGKMNDKEFITALCLWQNAQRLLEPLPVLIPYAGEIDFPTKPLRVRRDRPRFFTLIEACALVHQYQRERKEINGQTFIVANLDDYAIARELGVKVLGTMLKGATPKCEELVQAASIVGDGFTRTQIEAKLGWDRKTVTKYLREAVALGCLDYISHGKGKAAIYEFVKDVSEVNSGLISVDDLKDRLSNLSNAMETVNG